jgi:coatomer protein complex subunit alpha (xenin)
MLGFVSATVQLYIS